MADEGTSWGGMLKAMHQASMSIMRFTISKPLGWLYDQFKQPVAHGASELSNALFTGQGFVLYGNGVVGEGPKVEAPKAEPVKQPEPAYLPEPPAAPKVEPPQMRKGMGM